VVADAHHFDANPESDPTFYLHADQAFHFDVYPVPDPMQSSSSQNFLRIQTTEEDYSIYTNPIFSSDPEPVFVNLLRSPGIDSHKLTRRDS
jgi:hypothetical protein